MKNKKQFAVLLAMAAWITLSVIAGSFQFLPGQWISSGYSSHYVGPHFLQLRASHALVRALQFAIPGLVFGAVFFWWFKS